MSRTLLLTAAMLACLAGPALAQPVSTAVSTTHPPAPHSMADADRYIKRLHDQLGITAAELPQWDQYTQVIRDNAERLSSALSDRAANISVMNAAENMESYAKLASLHADYIQKLASSFKALYDSFPAAQKQLADKVFRTQHAA